ncbi:type II secretion system protein GspM [Thiosulfativibrio zosterae]|uniref:Type II secretion system protein M n=1 Tax=Thiosulfativibrio zosterae TaxID=2675053 RepID=A0A6F8PKQ2_9GAMM|nr:type II secretion system protein M [Thiosulfativibrio zosterae]BBP42675.1 hypothetical protein THMIRHAT_04210 [Thiosulfativibrio zosterae]
MFKTWMQSPSLQKWLALYEGWLQQRTPREKQLLSGLLVILVVAILYGLIWAPIQTNHQKAQAKMAVAEEKWQWLKAQIPTWEQQGKASPSLKLSSQSALMQYVQTQLKQQNLFQAMDKMTPQQKQIDISFKSVNAPRFFRWLSQMEQQGLSAKTLQVDLQAPGLVDAKVSFEVML